MLQEDSPSTVAEVPVDAEGTDCREFNYSFHCSLMLLYEGLADEYLWVPHSKCCFKPEKVQNILIHPVSVHGKTAEHERGIRV